jgi:cyclopropane fatty-acyl-phospholipid synthase-like methyltransferase
MVEAAGATLQGGLVKRSGDACVDPDTSNVYLAELAGVSSDNRILDAGCGVGGPALAIAKAFSEVVIDGVTVSPVQAELARELIAAAGLTDRVRVHVSDFHRLPFPDESFDATLYFEVTGYSSDRAALYRESARVLKPDGKVYVKDLFRHEDPLSAQQRRSMTAFDRLWSCVRSPTLSETANAMQHAGLVDVETRRYPFVDMDHYYESMVCRDEDGLRLNAFGKGFFWVDPSLPVFFGEAKARKRGPTTHAGLRHQSS